MSSYNADQLATMILKQADMDKEDLGPSSDEQRSYVYQYMNIFLKKNARKAYIVKFSDPLNITADGFQTFLKGGQVIIDMFEPLMLLDSTEHQVQKRMSYDAPLGWWREDVYTGIHTRGLTGLHTLKYLKYPGEITLGTQTPEYPPSGYYEMINEIVAMIKMSKNSLEEVNAVKALAASSRTAAVKANISGRGPSSGGQPPSLADVD